MSRYIKAIVLISNYMAYASSSQSHAYREGTVDQCVNRDKCC